MASASSSPPTSTSDSSDLLLAVVVGRANKEANTNVRAAGAAAVSAIATARAPTSTSSGGAPPHPTSTWTPLLPISPSGAAAAIDAFGKDVKEKKNGDVVLMLLALGSQLQLGSGGQLQLGVSGGPSFVVRRLLDMIAKAGAKAPPALAISVNEFLAVHALPKWGVARLPPAALLLPHLISDSAGAAATAPAVKASALAAFVVLHEQVGPPLLNSLTRLAAAVPTSAAPLKEGGSSQPPQAHALSERALDSIKAALEASSSSGGGGGYSVARARAQLDAMPMCAGETQPPVIHLHGEAPPPPPPSSSSLKGAGAGAAQSSQPQQQQPQPQQQRLDVFSLFPSKPGPLALCAAMEVESMSASEAGGGHASSTSAAAGSGSGDGDRKPWQVRMDAVSTVLDALTALWRSSSGGGGGGDLSMMGMGGSPAAPPPPSLLLNENLQALVRSLRKRLSDSQANVKPRAAAALGALAPLMPDVDAKKSVCRSIVPALLELLIDKKTLVHEGALSALEAWATDGASLSAPITTTAATAAAVPSKASGATTVNTPLAPLTSMSGFIAILEASTLTEPSYRITWSARELFLPFLARHADAIPRCAASLGPFQVSLLRGGRRLTCILTCDRGGR